jgi:tRNA(adenine34) deaminase
VQSAPQSPSPDTRAEQAELDLHFMRLALLEAETAYVAGEVPVGAVLVMPDQALRALQLPGGHPWFGRDGPLVIGRGGNRTRRDGLVHAHAELVALAAAEQARGDFRLEQAVAYVTLEPCLMCLGALYQARVARIVYGAREPKFGALGSRFDLGRHEALRRIEIQGGVLADEAAELMSRFFCQLRASTINGDAQQ